MTKEEYEEKAAKLLDGVYSGMDSDSRDVFKTKLAFYENRISHFEDMEIAYGHKIEEEEKGEIEF